MQIYSHPRTSVLPVLTIWIHIPQILILMIVLRYSIILYIYICYAPREILTSPVSLLVGCDHLTKWQKHLCFIYLPWVANHAVVPVRQFSWRFSDKHGLYDIKHRFGRNNKQTNSVILSPSSQAPLVSRGSSSPSHQEDRTARERKR